VVVAAAESPKVVVSWRPENWGPEDATDPPVKDLNGRLYYRRLVREVGGQKVVMVALPQTTSTDPPTFYIMENKVWNDLYAVFVADPKGKELLKKNSSPRQGLAGLVRGEWRKGGFAPNLNPDPEKEPFFGVEGPLKGRLPVFRVTVTEAHCFAEWLGGRLPTQAQWRKAAGMGEDTRPGPFDDRDKEDLAVGLKDGPWPVDRGKSDVSIHGCRQMASNGEEWTCDLDNGAVVPLLSMLNPPSVFKQGKSYLSKEPLTFEAMAMPRTRDCTTASFETTFRVVLQQQ